MKSFSMSKRLASVLAASLVCGGLSIASSVVGTWNGHYTVIGTSQVGNAPAESEGESADAALLLLKNGGALFGDTYPGTWKKSGSVASVDFSKQATKMVRAETGDANAKWKLKLKKIVASNQDGLSALMKMKQDYKQAGVRNRLQASGIYHAP